MYAFPVGFLPVGCLQLSLPPTYLTYLPCLVLGTYVQVPGKLAC